MGPPDHPLSRPWGHVRFIAKAFVVFVAIMTVVLLFKDISKPIDDARAAIYSRWWGAPLLFLVFLPFYLIYEVVRFQLWREIEKRQPDPQRRPVKRPGAPPARSGKRRVR